jgi:hypothetical protein
LQLPRSAKPAKFHAKSSYILSIHNVRKRSKCKLQAAEPARKSSAGGYCLDRTAAKTDAGESFTG